MPSLHELIPTNKPIKKIITYRIKYKSYSCTNKTMTLKDNGITIDLEYDGDGFPTITINTGGGFYSEHLRPTVDVILNDVNIHEMFQNDDNRWEK